MLFFIQEQETFLSSEAIHRIAQHTGLTDNEVYSFASFFPWLRFAPTSDDESTTASIIANPSQGLQGGLIRFEESSATAAGPVLCSPSNMGPVRVVSRHFGAIDPEKIGDYIDRGGYGGLDKALAAIPNEIETTIRQSGLSEEENLGLSYEHRWRLCRQSPGKEKYLIGHAAGIDPVSLVECALLENDPHSVLEGMLIAGYAAGASRGILYVDGRRSLTLFRLRAALDQMQGSGYLGNGIRGSDFSFHIQLIPAIGPLPCGEAQSVIPALEGKRPENCIGSGGLQQPMLHGLPAVIHSVETLARLSAIMNKGPDWYAGLGLRGHKGTKMVTLSGCIRQPGLVEVPLGISLREIIEDIGEGVSEGQTFKAVQVGGPTGGWLAVDDLDILLGCQPLAAAGTHLGSGSLVVAASGACAVDLARQALLFASILSCGHCNFCREGTRQMSEILHNIIRGRSKPEELELLVDLSEGLQLGSSCSLGRTAPDAFLTTFNRFRKEYETHMKKSDCLSGFCQTPNRESSVANIKRSD